MILLCLILSALSRRITGSIHEVLRFYEVLERQVQDQIPLWPCISASSGTPPEEIRWNGRPRARGILWLGKILPIHGGPTDRPLVDDERGLGRGTDSEGLLKGRVHHWKVEPEGQVIVVFWNTWSRLLHIVDDWSTYHQVPCNKLMRSKKKLINLLVIAISSKDEKQWNNQWNQIKKTFVVCVKAKNP